MVFSRRTGLLLVVFVSMAMLFMACGGGDWENLTKIGNTWDYEGEVSGAKVTAKVLGNWKVGGKIYAEIAPNFAAFSNVSKLCLFDDKSKQLLHVGETSQFNDGSKQFYMESRVLGEIKGNSAFTNTDGTVIRYVADETITVPAGKFSTQKFTHLNVERNVDMIVWFALKTGVVRVKAYGDTWQLTKFTEGKKEDPKILGGADAEKNAAFVDLFFKAAKAGDVGNLERFFSPGEGQEDFTRQRNTIADFVRRAANPDTTLDRVTYSFYGNTTVGVRFLQFVEGGFLPTVTRTDAVMELVPEGRDLRIKKINIANDTLY